MCFNACQTVLKMRYVIYVSAGWHRGCALVCKTADRHSARARDERADELSRKQDKQYSLVMGWIRCRLSFAILRSAILCIRGSRSSRHRPVSELKTLILPLERGMFLLICNVSVIFAFLFFLTLTTHSYTMKGVCRFEQNYACAGKRR